MVSPTADPDPWEEPGPPPRRHLTAKGKMLVVMAIAIPAAIVLALLIMVPSRFGFG